MKKKDDHCKRADCIFYDHKQYRNNCSASATQQRVKECWLFQERKTENARNEKSK